MANQGVKNRTNGNNSMNYEKSIEWMRNNDFSLKLSNLPNYTRRVEIKKLIANLNIKSFYIPRAKNTHRPLKYVYVNFWYENDMNFAKNIKLQLRNKNLIWICSKTKTCHRCGGIDHLVKKCRFIKKEQRLEKFNSKVKKEMRNMLDNDNNDQFKKAMEELKQTMFSQHEYFKREIDIMKIDQEKHLQNIEQRLKWDHDTALLWVRSLGSEVKEIGRASCRERV